MLQDKWEGGVVANGEMNLGVWFGLDEVVLHHLHVEPPPLMQLVASKLKFLEDLTIETVIG